MRILELFSGYGTASFALKRIGIPCECIGYSDIDKYANQCFKQNHSGKELGDVKLINPNELPDIDLLTGGTPCQDFSVAGKGKGLFDENGELTRSGEKNYNWKGGIGRRSPKSPKVKIWRETIFKRDNYTCQKCGQISGYLEVHHIKSWAKYPELRYNLKNGLTLCKECHKKTYNFGGKKIDTN